MQRLYPVLRLSRPVLVTFAALTYVLGTNISRYLGITQNALIFWLGLCGVGFVQFSMSTLAEALRPVDQPSGGNTHNTERVILRKSALQISVGALAAAGIIVVLFERENALSAPVIILLGASLLAVLTYAVPPFRLVDAGFGEFIMAVHIGFIIPGLGFALQSGEYHRLVAVVSFPLILLALAYFIVLNFPTFSDDEKYDRQTLLRRMGWERAVPMHHGLVLGAYAFLASTILMGLAWGLIWPAFLTLPFGLLQIFWIRNISNGAKPIWNLLTVNALAVFGLTTYLLIFAFWLR